MEHLILFLYYATFILLLVLLMGLIEKLPIINKLTNLFLNEED